MRIYIYIYGGKYEKTREKENYTVCFLRELALFGEREEDLLRGCFGDCAFQVGGDVHRAVWTVYLVVVMMRKTRNHEHLTASCEPA